MCTVTFITTKEGFYLTSNRDEKSSRKTIPPTKYDQNGIEIYYPKDDLAGGTWIASSNNGKTACLLNGAFEKHEKKNFYKKSRGLILLESFQYQSTTTFVDRINLNEIEPFTLILIDYQNEKLNTFHELRWDGSKKYLIELDFTKNYIWSSATLYDQEVQNKRANLFNHWLKKHETFEDKHIIHFHNQKHGLSTNEDLLMKGKHDLQTISISQIHHSHSVVSFNYLDLIERTNKSLQIIQKEKQYV